MGFIDLGELTDGEPEPPSAGPLWTRWRRRVQVLGLVAVTLLTCGAVETARVPPLHEVFSVSSPSRGRSDQQLLIDNDNLFRVYREGATTWLASYDLTRSGRRLWRVPVDASAVGSLVLIGRRLFLQRFPAGQPTDDGALLTPVAMAFDKGTGASAWSVEGFPFARLGEDKLLFSRGNDLVGVDAATGRELWKRSPGEGGAALVGGETPVAPWRVAFAEGTTLRIVDLESGQVLRSRDLGPDKGGANRFGGLFATSKALVLRQGSSYTTYDPETLEQLWTASAPESEWAMPCGELLCQMSGPEVVAVDVATGRTRWTTRTDGLYLTGAGVNGAMLGNARGTGIRMVDAATGQELLNLGRWTPLPGHDGSAGRLALSGIFEGVDWVGVADVGSRRIRPLAKLPGAGDETCVASEKYLVCTLISEKLTAWTF
ncbi:outer membrane protein assembly factor BamB family protein [Longispora urticae]